MDFQLRKDARNWFKYIEKDYPILFDLYYLCLMVGFASGRRNPEITSDEVDGLVDYFPGEFRSRGRLLVASLIHTELRRLQIDLKDRDAVYREVKNIVDPDSPSYLSNEGVNRMNVYAHGGYDLLCEEFSDRPRSIETFVRQYFQFITRLKKGELNL